jgi:PAS domain S-box-containing protein
LAASSHLLPADLNVLQKLGDHIGAFVVYIDRDRRFRYVNAAYQKWVRKDANALLGHTIWEAIGEGAYQALKPFVDRALAGEEVTYETEVPYEDRGVRLVNATLIPDKKEGNVHGFVAIIRDIVDSPDSRPLAQVRLLESMREGVSLTNEDGVIIYTNPGLDRMYGYKGGELNGNHAAILSDYPDAAREHLYKEIRDAISTEGSWEGEIVSKRKDGTRCIVEARITSIQFGGRTYMLSVRQDVTEKRFTERFVSLQHNVTAALADSENATEAAMRVIRLLCDELAWEVGNVYVLNDAGSALEHYVQCNGEPTGEFERLSRSLTFERGIGLPGLVWESGQPVLMSDFQGDPTLPRLMAAKKAGLHGALAFPISSESGFLGVMEFFSSQIRQPEVSLLSFLKAVGAQIGQFLDRVRSREELLQSEQRFRRLIEQSPMSVQIIRGDGVTTGTNRAWERLWGVTLDLLEGYNILEDEQLQQNGVAPLLRQVFQGKTVDLPLVPYVPDRGEYKGQERWVRAFAYPVLVDDEVREVVLVHEDVTETRLSQEALTQSEARFRLLSEASPGFVYMASPAGEMDFISANWTSFTGLGLKETNERLLQIVHPEDAEGMALAWSTALAAGEPFVSEFRIRRKDSGDYRWFLSRAIPQLDDKGEVICWVGYTTDIHDRKTEEARLDRLVQERTAALEEANRQLHGFTYTVSHDLRGPLRRMMFNAVLLKDELGDNLPEEACQSLEDLQESARKMVRLVDDLLQVARLGRHKLTTEDLDLTRMAKEIAADESNRHAHIHVEEGLHAKGDPQLVKMVLENLIGNAVKFAKKGSTPEVCIGQSDNVFHVCDNGIGFEPEFAHKLFQPFERLVRDDEYPGTGIGLANVKSVIERHGGAVWTQATPGEGATFFFTLGCPG